MAILLIGMTKNKMLEFTIILTANIIKFDQTFSN